MPPECDDHCLLRFGENSRTRLLRPGLQVLEAQLTDLFGTAGAFLSPKNSRFVRRFINQAAEKDSTILDCFGGSGSSAHAVIEANRLDLGHRKFITVEVNRYFETLVVPRIKKVGSAAQWKSGMAKDLRGPGIFVRVHELEQYDDTLESLSIDQQAVQDAMAFENLAFSIQYRLDREARQLFQSVDHFRSPFGYSIKCAHGGGEAVDREVDLVESLIYLLGLDVARLYREDQGVVTLTRILAKPIPLDWVEQDHLFGLPAA